jgi:hypothetical protein
MLWCVGAIWEEWEEWDVGRDCQFGLSGKTMILVLGGVCEVYDISEIEQFGCFSSMITYLKKESE